MSQCSNCTRALTCCGGNIVRRHQGLSKMAYTPTYRGFDTSFGFLTGGENHYTQNTCCDDIDTEKYPNCSGPVDLWGGEAPLIGDPRHFDEGGDKQCGFAGRPDCHDANYNGYNFPAEAVRLIETHNKSQPFFLYFALRKLHACSHCHTTAQPTQHVDAGHTMPVGCSVQTTRTRRFRYSVALTSAPLRLAGLSIPPLLCDTLACLVHSSLLCCAVFAWKI